MFIKPCPKGYQLLPLLLLLSFGLGLISCTTTPNGAETAVPQTTETTLPIEALYTAAPAATVDILPTEETQEATPTSMPMSPATKVITSPTLINLKIPLQTENLPAYGWFSEDSQVVYFAYPEEGVAFSYDIVAQQLISTTLSQKSNEEVIAQITADLPLEAHVVEISPRYQKVLFTVPLSQPVTIELPSYSLEVYDALWLYEEGQSIRLGVVDRCFQLHLTHDILWSASEDLATVFAISPMDCAWSNWLINLEAYTVGPVYYGWEVELPAYAVVSFLPNKQLLLNPLLRNKPSSILDLQTQELIGLSNRGNEIAKYLDETVLLDLIFRSGDKATEDITEVGFSFLNETDRQLIGTIEGALRAKYVSPDQKHVLLFGGSPDYYGLSDNQKTSGVWLLMFP